MERDPLEESPIIFPRLKYGVRVSTVRLSKSRGRPTAAETERSKEQNLVMLRLSNDRLGEILHGQI